MKLRMISVLFCVLLLLTCCAQADTSVTFEDMHYGDEAFQMHLNNEVNKLIFEGEEYLLEDDSFQFREAMTVYGGKTHAVYEMTLPQGKFSVTPTGEELLIGMVEINIPRKATLYVGSGNRRSGEYVLEGPLTLTDVYREEIRLPRSEQGAPLLIDRVYLYSYEENGETHRYAATLYIDYDGYAASYAGTAAPAVTAEPVIDVPTDVPADDNVPSDAAPVAVILLLIIGVTALLAKKRRKPARLPAADTEKTSFVDQAEAMLANAAQCRRFLSYYLPTTLKMLASYRRISESGVSGTDVDKVHQSTCKGMDMILDACQKLLDNLYKGDVQDTSLDVEILEKMLKQDGLIDNELDLSRILPVDEE